MRVSATSSIAHEFYFMVLLGEIFNRIFQAIASALKAISSPQEDVTSLDYRVQKMKCSSPQAEAALEQAKTLLKIMPKENNEEHQTECKKVLAQVSRHSHADKIAELCQLAIEKASTCTFQIKRMIQSLNSSNRDHVHILRKLPSEIPEALKLILCYCRTLPTDLTNTDRIHQAMTKGEKSDPLQLSIQFYQKLIGVSE